MFKKFTWIFVCANLSIASLSSPGYSSSFSFFNSKKKSELESEAASLKSKTLILSSELLKKDSDIERLKEEIESLKKDIEQRDILESQTLNSAEIKAKRIIEHAHQEAQVSLKQFEQDHAKKTEQAHLELEAIYQELEKIQETKNQLILETFETDDLELNEILTDGVRFQIEGVTLKFNQWQLQRIKWTPLFFMLIPNRAFKPETTPEGIVLLDDEDIITFRYLYNFIKSPGGHVIGLESLTVEDLSRVLERSEYYGIDDFSKKLKAMILLKKQAGIVHVATFQLEDNQSLRGKEKIDQFIQSLQEKHTIEIINVCPMNVGHKDKASYSSRSWGYGYDHTGFVKIFYKITG